MRARSAALAAPVLVLALTGAACSSDSGDAGASSAGTTAGSITEGTDAQGALEIFVEGSPYGDHLVDGDARTLYLFKNDEVGKPSACTGGCADAWPAAEATSVVAGSTVDPMAGGAVEQSVLGVTDDGQATAGGHRLYYFVGDTEPDAIEGQGTGGVWYIVGPTGEAVEGDG